MTKTEVCRRVALAALLAGTIAAAQEASAGIASNGIDLNGLANRSSALPEDGGGPDSAEIAAGTAKTDPTPTSDLSGAMVPAGTQKLDITPTPK